MILKAFILISIYLLITKIVFFFINEKYHVYLINLKTYI